MKGRRVAGILCLGAALAAAAVGFTAIRGDRHPNIILVSIDTLRADHLGCYGYGRNTSPALDRLAHEGVLFETVIASTSWTLPSHAALFTGLPDRVHGCVSEKRWLDASRRTLAEALREAGYRTAGFYSGPFLHPYFGLGQGFDHYEECTSYRDRITAMIRKGRYETGLEKVVWNDVTNPVVRRSVLNWLASGPRRPFFLFIHMWDVHRDYIPPPPFDTMFAKEGAVRGSLPDLISRYDGEIRSTDETLRAILGALEARGLEGGTLVAVTADHGEAFDEHGHRGHRNTLHDEEVRVPLIIRYPRRIEPGTRIDRVVRTIDVAPTLLDLAGLPPLEDALGRSLASLAGGREAGWADLPAVSEFRDHRASLALRTRNWKLVLDHVTGTATVFDLKADPGEQRPLEPSRAPAPPQEIATLYEATVRRLDAAAARLPVPEARDWSALPDVHRRHLKSLGYLK